MLHYSWLQDDLYPLLSTRESSDCYFGCPISECYFEDDNNLPEGVLNLEKCVRGVPMAASLPHFLYADPKVREGVKGVTEPNPEKHSMYMDVEQRLGALLGTRIRIQVNLVIKRDKAFPPLANIKVSTPIPFSGVDILKEIHCRSESDVRVPASLKKPFEVDTVLLLAFGHLSYVLCCAIFAYWQISLG